MLGELAGAGARLDRGDLVAVVGSVHYGAANYHGAYVRAKRIERVADTEAPDTDTETEPPTEETE